MSISFQSSKDSSAKTTMVLALGALAVGAAIRLITPSALVFTVFLVLLACVFASLFLVSLGQAGASTWKAALLYPLAVLGLWPSVRPASPAGVRSGILVVVLASFAGFTLLQLTLALG